MTSSVLEIANSALKLIREYFELTKVLTKDNILDRALRDINISGYEFMQNALRELPGEIEKVGIVELLKDPVNFDVFDSLFRVMSDANKLLKLIAGEQTRNRAKQTMSQSYFDDLSINVEELNALRKKIYREVEKLISAIVGDYKIVEKDSTAIAHSSLMPDNATLETLYKNFIKVPVRSYFSYRLLVVLLTKLADSDLDISKLTEYVKDNVFGVIDRDSVFADLAERAKYHPIQSMGLTFGLVAGEEAKKTDSDLVIDLTMPAGNAIKYDLDALLEPSTETTASGLNHKIITRLNTIKEVDKSPSAGDAKIVVLDDPKSVIQTIDGGLTFAKCETGERATNMYKYCGAGPKLRVDAINKCIQDIVMTRVQDPTKLLADYEQKSESFKFPFASRLVRYIVIEQEQKAAEAKLARSLELDLQGKPLLSKGQTASWGPLPLAESRPERIDAPPREKVDSVIFNALFNTLSEYCKEFAGDLITYPDIEDEANAWILTLLVSLTPKVSRIVKKNKSGKVADLENALEEIADGIPMVPFKIFGKLLRIESL